MNAERVLIVEDDRQIVRAIAPALAVSGYEVGSARTLAEARSLVAEGWHIAVIDLGLPDGEGSDLIAPLSEAGIAIVVITARDDEREAEEALRRGASAFLKKPFAAPDLVRTIDALTH